MSSGYWSYPRAGFFHIKILNILYAYILQCYLIYLFQNLRIIFSSLSLSKVLSVLTCLSLFLSLEPNLGRTTSFKYL